MPGAGSAPASRGRLPRRSRPVPTVPSALRAPLCYFLREPGHPARPAPLRRTLQDCVRPPWLCTACPRGDRVTRLGRSCPPNAAPDTQSHVTLAACVLPVAWDGQGGPGLARVGVGVLTLGASPPARPLPPLHLLPGFVLRSPAPKDRAGGRFGKGVSQVFPGGARLRIGWWPAACAAPGPSPPPWPGSGPSGSGHGLHRRLSPRGAALGPLAQAAPEPRRARGKAGVRTFRKPPGDSQAPGVGPDTGGLEGSGETRGENRGAVRPRAFWLLRGQTVTWCTVSFALGVQDLVQAVTVSDLVRKGRVG